MSAIYALRHDPRQAAPEEIDRRPQIQLTPDIHVVTDQMVSALSTDPAVYQRAGDLVHVVSHESEDDARFPPGTPLIRVAPASWVGDRISAVGRVVKQRGEDWVHTKPPPDRVRAVCERGAWARIPWLVGISETPTMRPDGTILQTPGYDAATRTIYAPNAAFPRILDEPSQSDAALAYAHLADVFRDFPYVSTEHRSASIAALLTLLVRFAIRGSVPAWVFDAASKRSGKSLQMDVIHIIATGRACSRMTFPADDDKELESVLASYALVSARVVPFDNVSRPFGGAPLDKCITAVDSVDLRVLGRTEMRTMQWMAVVMASGNNVTFTGDMLPRVLSPRIESPLENPELLEARDLKAFARERRVDLVVDALTLLRAYAVAGHPPQGIRWGGFEGWAALIPSALVWAGAPSPMGARRGLEGDEDPQRSAEAALVHGWDRLCGKLDPSGVTVSKALSELYPAPRRGDAPDEWDALREAIDELAGAKPGCTPSSTRVSGALRRIQARPIGGLRVAHGGKASGGGIRWRTRPSL
jgi:putative DNA primase/helicase